MPGRDRIKCLIPNVIRARTQRQGAGPSAPPTGELRQCGKNCFCSSSFVFAAVAAHAADRIKVGFVSTLSGPQGAPGIDSRDGFQLAVKMLGGKLGDLPVEVLVADDQFNPEAGKQTVERFVKRDRVDFVTGIIYSNVLLAAAPAAFDAKVPYVSSNAGAVAARRRAAAIRTSSAPPGRTTAPTRRRASTRRTRASRPSTCMAPNYPAGKDALAGFKRFYKGKIVDEVYPKLGQLDFAAELAQLRAAKPEAVYAFMPGGMGINFIKQYVAAGLSKDIQLVVPGFGADEDTIKAVGEPMLGLFNPRTGRPTSTMRRASASSPRSRRSTAASRPCTRRRASTRR